MKVLLGTCLALTLAASAPAFADQDASGAPSQLGAHAGSQAGSAMYNQGDEDMNAQPGSGGDDQARPRHHRADRDRGDRGDRQARHGRHQHRQYAEGEHVKPKLLRGRHVVTDYSRFGVNAPRNGDVWIKAHKQLMLVSADGVVKSIVARPHHHKNRRYMQDGQGGPDAGPRHRGYDQSAPNDQGGDDQDQMDDQGGDDDSR